MKRSGQIFLVAVIALLLFSSVLYGDTWRANRRLTTNSGYSGNSAIAVDGENIYVVWEDDTPGNKEIYFKKSLDGGANWTANRRLTNNSGASTCPDIAVEGDNIYVVWEDDTPGNKEIYFKKSLDGGANWRANRRLTRTAFDSTDPAIAVDGENIYVVWEEHEWWGTTIDAKVYFKQSFDRGANWEANRRLSDTGSDQLLGPDIAVNGQYIYVAWSGSDHLSGEDYISFRRSINGGDTWEEGTRLTSAEDMILVPKIAAAGSKVYVVWPYCPDPLEDNCEIFFKRSNNEGVDWNENMRIATASLSYSSAIAAKGSNIYVVWVDYTPGNHEIYFKRSANEGINWEANRRLTNNSGASMFPAIAADASNVYVVWEDSKPGNYEIYFKKCVLD